ncbi:GumC family protein [Chthonobacter albigriseus]|uniref:GumC family protein n=1 Tax=Chthonobacter albigriseus TaxID=1683161 RepID=UPI0015EE50A1|nr:exopolysaccharide transport family protein [Chthonobacter albigriseus]
MSGSVEARQHVEDDVALDLSGILGAIWRRKFAVLATTVLLGAGAYGLLSMIPPRYQAETKILIEDRGISLGTEKAAGDKAVIDQESVASQVQLLTSRDLARRVAQSEALADKSEFDGSRGSLLHTLLVAAGIGSDPMRVAPEERVLDAFSERLQVYRVEGSRVVVAQFTSEDPELASSVANSVVAAYMALQAEAKRRMSEDQTRWLGDEIESLRAKVTEAERAVETYRSGNDLFVGENNATLARQQITDLNNSLAAARSDKAAAQSRADALRALLDRPSDLQSATEVLDSETFKTLRNREVALRTRLSELSVALLPGHPTIRAIKAQISDILAQEVAEARRMLAGLENDVTVADARIASLTASLEQLKSTSAQNSDSEVELRALEREATSQRNLLEGMLVRYREAIARQNAEVMPADARVISRASVPSEPTFPKVVPLTIVATVAGFLLSLGWVITAEFLSGRALRRVSVVPEKPLALESDVVATEPAVVEMPVRRPTVADAVEADLVRATDELRRAHAGSAQRAEVDLPTAGLDVIHAMLVSEDARRVAIMGVGEAFAVERSIALLSDFAVSDGAKVVVVDTVPGHAGIGGTGLSDLIAGDAPFSDVIRRNPATRAHEIGVGRRPLDPEMLSGSTVETLLSALEHTYDLVLLDLGALDPDLDRFRLIASADHTILVGDTADPEVVRIYGLLTSEGGTRVTIAPPWTDVVGVAA